MMPTALQVIKESHEWAKKQNSSSENRLMQGYIKGLEYAMAAIDTEQIQRAAIKAYLAKATLRPPFAKPERADTSTCLWIIVKKTLNHTENDTSQKRT